MSRVSEERKKQIRNFYDLQRVVDINDIRKNLIHHSHDPREILMLAEESKANLTSDDLYNVGYQASKIENIKGFEGAFYPRSYTNFRGALSGATKRFGLTNKYEADEEAMKTLLSQIVNEHYKMSPDFEQDFDLTAKFMGVTRRELRDRMVSYFQKNMHFLTDKQYRDIALFFIHNVYFKISFMDMMEGGARRRTSRRRSRTSKRRVTRKRSSYRRRK